MAKKLVKFDPSSIAQETIPLYHGTLWFVRTPEEFIGLATLLKMPLGEASASGFIVEHMSDGLSQTHVNALGHGEYLLGVFNKESGVIAHECGHIAIMICERAGFSPDDGDGEPFCYLLGWLAFMCEKHFK